MVYGFPVDIRVNVITWRVIIMHEENLHSWLTFLNI